MRANVQGLEEEDSDGDIEIVDFADGENINLVVVVEHYYGDLDIVCFVIVSFFDICW